MHTSTIASKEAKFDINELFFSITSPDSRIVSGNEVFVRISEYSREELIGSYHNIVRHPDMPKVVFKILWDRLKADKPVVAYVKNRTKHGDYYWVLAAVFPIDERYVSIRIKPGTKIFELIKELYPVLLNAEQEEGIEKSYETLLQALRSAGYEDYEHFMSDALLQELRLRKSVVVSGREQRSKELSSRSAARYLHLALGYTQTLMEGYDTWFDKIDHFLEVKTMFEEKSLRLRQIAGDMVFLSLNASVCAYRFASGGETFGILAGDIRINAKENYNLIGSIDIASKNISEALNDIIFSVCGMRLQAETLSYFIDELLCEDCNLQGDEAETNMVTLIRLVSDYTAKSNALQVAIDQRLQEVVTLFASLEQQMLYLGYIQVYGIIEAASRGAEAVDFEEIFSQLKRLIASAGEEIEAMDKKGKNLRSENRTLIEKFKTYSPLLHRLDETMRTLQSIHLR